MASKRKVVKKGKKQRKPTVSTRKGDFYKPGVQRRTCPKCGAGIFMAEHKDRHHCGKCSYTEFKKT